MGPFQGRVIRGWPEAARVDRWREATQGTTLGYAPTDAPVGENGRRRRHCRGKEALASPPPSDALTGTP